MDPVAAFLLSAIKQTAAVFAREHPLGFLVRRPTSLPSERPPALSDEATEALGFETTVYNTSPVRDASGTVLEESLDPTAWIALEVRKRAGNPYPQRIGIGRARNCDIVLRLSSVSKLHAHLHLADGRVVSVTDNRSSNGTWLNGARVGSDPMPVAFGSTLRFGVVKLEYVPAETFQAWITRAKP